MAEQSVVADIGGELKALVGLDTVEYKIDLPKDELFHEAIANDRGRVAKGGPTDAQKAFATKLGADGPLVYYTDPDCTGRPVQDTFAVARPGFVDKLWWKPDFKQFDGDKFDALLDRVVAHLNEKNATLYVKNVYCGSDPSYARPYRFVGEFATHALFAHNMFPKGIEGVEDEAGKRWTMLNAPSFVPDPERDGTLGNRAVIIDPERQIGLVIGPADYSGIVKKTMFTVMNYVLPEQGYLGMHCSANVGQDGDGAILFGLSGTGKTTLSADPESRKLIGDDEHAWTAGGISNLEDGCYAKADRSRQGCRARHRRCAVDEAGTLIENVPRATRQEDRGHGPAGPRPQRTTRSPRTLASRTR